MQREICVYDPKHIIYSELLYHNEFLDSFVSAFGGVDNHQIMRNVKSLHVT